MKKGVILSVLSLSLVLAACSSSGDAKLTSVKSGTKLQDIHGVGISNDGTTYVANHEGLLSTKDGGKTWNKVGASNDDLMGFTMRSDGTMMTSGHPGINQNTLIQSEC